MTTSRQPVTIVTGGGQGIGKAIAIRFLEENHIVVIAELDRAAGSETVDELRDKGTVLFIPTDVGREEHVKTLIAQAVDHFGRIDNLINNAGISSNKAIAELSLDQWNRVICTNLTGTFLCSKYAVAHLATRRGSIINLSSTRAWMSEPNTEAYSASKGGVSALTHALAISLGPAIRVNSISPGWIEVCDWKKRAARITPELKPADHAQHPAGRVGRPQDIAELALYLCSDKASFITGQDFVVDGGMTKKMIYVE